MGKAHLFFMKMVKSRVMMGLILLAIGSVMGWSESWKMYFEHWTGWTWTLFVVIGAIIIIQGIFKIMYATGIGFFIIGAIWGSSMGWLYDTTQPYQNWMWMWMLVVGVSLIIFRMMIGILTGRSWYKKKKEKEYVCPNGYVWDENAKSCILEKNFD
jgi:hypothetical protein